jgi:hypothetical protein
MLIQPTEEGIVMTVNDLVAEAEARQLPLRQWDHFWTEKVSSRLRSVTKPCELITITKPRVYTISGR